MRSKASSLPLSLSGVVWRSNFLGLQMLDFPSFSHGSSKVHGGTINIAKHTSWELSPQNSPLGGYRCTSPLLIAEWAERGPEDLWIQSKLLQAELFPLSTSMSCSSRSSFLPTPRAGAWARLTSLGSFSAVFGEGFWDHKPAGPRGAPWCSLGISCQVTGWWGHTYAWQLMWYAML